ncbi:helix-turn-helix domain-containing protein [Enterococcus faecalis]|uniref:helix-turn-helix domain-containing protein n=1 Tax=Enterococcus faecalis TaxID=1351 RepID=UPI003D118BC5
MDVNKIIGVNLKKIRKTKNLTLDELSSITEVSKGMLSQIEKGKTSPTINTIWKISNGLNIPYTYLLENHHLKERPLVKRDETTIQHSEDRTYRVFNYYSDTQERNFELFQFELDSGKTYKSIGHSKRSTEYVMVIQGELEIRVDGKIYTVPKNAAVYFDANQEHTYLNHGSEMVLAVFMNYYT